MVSKEFGLVESPRPQFFWMHRNRNQRIKRRGKVGPMKRKHAVCLSGGIAHAGILNLFHKIRSGFAILNDRDKTIKAKRGTAHIMCFSIIRWPVADWTERKIKIPQLLFA